MQGGLLIELLDMSLFCHMRKGVKWRRAKAGKSCSKALPKSTRTSKTKFASSLLALLPGVDLRLNVFVFAGVQHNNHQMQPSVSSRSLGIQCLNGAFQEGAVDICLGLSFEDCKEEN